MQPAGNYHEGYERVRQLSALFLRRLHEIAGEVYAEVLSSGVIRPEEMEEEIQRYFAKKKSGLQDVYSYYGEQWDYYYQVVAASDADFLSMLQQARSAFVRLYVPVELDASYYMEQLVRFPRTDSRWQALRQHFIKKWRNLLEGRERTYQKRHIERLCEDYYRMVSANVGMLQNVGGKGEGPSPRLAWLQLTQSPELRVKLRQLSQVIRKSQLIKELNHVLGRKKADEQRLYQAMSGKTPVTLLRSATHSDGREQSERPAADGILFLVGCRFGTDFLPPLCRKETGGLRCRISADRICRSFFVQRTRLTETGQTWPFCGLCGYVRFDGRGT